MQTLSASFKDNVAYLDQTLRVDKSFDLIRRTIKIGEDDVVLYYIDGFIKDDTMLRIIQYFFTLKGAGDADSFAARHVPYVEVDVASDMQTLITAVLSGAAVMLASTFGGKAIIIDARTYPSRETAEPESDKVMQGAKDGFVETLIFNTALIRRRIRDPRLTMHYQNLGGGSRTDVVVCYVEGLADQKYVERLKKLLSSIKPESLTLGFQSLAEILIPRRWYNPFPKIRTVERPDAAAAQLMEGNVLVLCDTSPRVMVLPTSILDFLQETDDYYFPPLTGSYQRIVRFLCAITTLLLLPTWYLFLRHSAWLGGMWSNFVPKEMGVLPILAQLLLAELAIDVLKLASMNTPNMLSNSLSIIGGLILGDFAVTVGWLSSDVILYMAITAITAFSQKSQELAYATKFMRVLLILLVAVLDVWGYAIGLLLIPVAILCNRTIGDTHTYLSPLIPFRPKALARLF
ncbi:MAG: spore germination protein, partial [Clostridia bacterium]|nr:spore germination protein [Clostridia bacterium]